MTLLILGLLSFLGLHSVRIVAEPARLALIARFGPTAWKLGYSLVSALGLALIVLGYAAAREQPLILWTPPAAMRHLAALLTLPAFVLFVAAKLPGNALRARLGHPLVLGVKLWGLAHLLANGSLADLLLFGSFTAWAVLSFRAARQRERAAGTVRAPGRLLPTLLTLAFGLALWALFAFRLHADWIGVAPFARG